MARIEYKQRDQLGMGAPKGYVLIVDGKPVLQFHYYHPHYTVFWMGTTVLSDLLYCYRETVEELSEMFNIPKNLSQNDN